MHVSISKLGAKEADASGAARAVVVYLTGQQQRPAGERGVAEPELGRDAAPGGYYADSAQRPGRWHGRGAEAIIPAESRDYVEPEMLERVLLGHHATTGEQLVGAAGSSGRGDKTVHSEVLVDPTGPPDELLTADQAAKLVGVAEKRYLQSIARETATVRAEIAAAVNSGVGLPALPRTYLDGIKVPGTTQNRPEWRFERGEVERFMAARKEPAVVMGFDLTYSAPKETSLAWAVADADGKARIEEHLHSAAVGEAALNYVENNAMFVRRGRGHEHADGMIAASFLHNTSRELEPQLHVHVVVANMAQGVDGSWQTLDGRGIYAHAGTSGYLADAEFQAAMNADGFAHGPTVKGISHLVGINAEAVDAMSSGRTRIMEEVGAVGADSPAARQLAALATRPAKDSSVDLDELQAMWLERLAESGFGPAQQALLRTHEAPVLWTPDDTTRLYRHLSSSSGVTEQVAMFDRRHVIEAITDRVGGRLTAAEILDHADTWLASENVVKMQVVDGIQGDLIGEVGKVSLTPGLDLYTTPEIVRTEQHITAGYLRGHDAGAGVVHPHIASAAIDTWQKRTGHTLGDDQAAMVRAITSTGDRMQAVLGPAGSGKTTALEVAARAWEHAGYKLFGAAVNGTAAEVLQASTGIESTTVAGLVTRLDIAAADGRKVLDDRSVIIVDEASTLGNRAHSRLIHHVEEAGATLRTVGDPAQHSSVEAGGMWAHITRVHADRTPELVENRRMKGPEMADMRLAATDYRQGKIDEALARINDSGRMVTAGTGNELLDSLAADWYVDWKRHQLDPTTVKPSRMLSENHAARSELNRRAQVLLKADGTLTGDGVRIGDSTFHVGDQVIARAQNRNLRPEGGGHKSYVRNGTKGTVVGIGDGDQPGLQVNFEDRGVIDVPHEWLTKKLREGVTGGLTPAYAMTTHAAQGDTFDASHSLVTDRSSREGQYVALTRGEHDVRFYAVDAADFAPEPPAAEHGLAIIKDRGELLDEIEAKLTRPKPADLATVSDLDIAAVVQYQHSGIGLRELETVSSPHADRAADMITARVTAQVKANPPPPLTAMLGERHPTDAQRWDRAAEAYAIYHERWQLTPAEGQVAVEPADMAPSGQQRDFDTVRAALVDARAHNNRHLTPPELAATRRDLTHRLAAIRPVDAGLDSAITKQLQGRVAELTERVARYQTDLDRASKPKNRRTNRDGPEIARRALAKTQTDLDIARAHLADQLAIVNPPAHPTSSAQRTAMERDVIDTLIDRHTLAATSTPQPYRTKALALRPEDPESAQRWDTAAASVERYRIGTLGRGPETGPAAPDTDGLVHAIGKRPSEPAGQRQWDTVHQHVAAITQPPQGAPTPQVMPGPRISR